MLAAIVVSLYLVVYVQLIWFESTREIALIKLLFSPVMMIWMVYMIIRYGIYKGRELGKDEYGYFDKEQNRIQPD